MAVEDIEDPLAFWEADAEAPQGTLFPAERTAPPLVSVEQEFEHLTLEDQNIQREYGRIAPMISRQGRVVYEKAVAAGRAEAERKRKHAEIYLRARSVLAAQGVKGRGGAGPTEAQVEAAVMTTYYDEWLAAHLEDVEAQAALGVAKTDLRALDVSAMMLTQRGSDIRAELKTINPLLLTPEESARRANEACPPYEKQT